MPDLKTSRRAVAIQPDDAAAVLQHAMELLTIGSPPLPLELIATWLARAWTAGLEVLSNKDLVRLKQIAFALSTYSPGMLALVRPILLAERPCKADPTFAAYDAGISWRYTNGGRLPKVICVFNKHKNGYPGERPGGSAYEVNFRRSIVGSTVISGTYAYLDEFFIVHGRPIWPDLLAFVAANGCDVLVLHISANKRAMDSLLPTGDQAQQLKRLGCRIVLLATDLMYPKYREVLQRQLGAIGDWYLSIDIPSFLADELNLSERLGLPTIGSWTPQDMSLYDRGPVLRDIDVGFCGAIYPASGRQEFLDYLSGRGINVRTNGPNRIFSFDEYVDFLGRSLLTLNVSVSNIYETVDPIFGDQVQIKGRVFEGMAAGSALLERDSACARRMFRDMEDIVLYRDRADAADRIAFLLKNRDLARRIGTVARGRVAARYDINAFWRHVLARLSLSDRTS